MGIVVLLAICIIMAVSWFVSPLLNAGDAALPSPVPDKLTPQARADKLADLSAHVPRPAATPDPAVRPPEVPATDSTPRRMDGNEAGSAANANRKASGKEKKKRKPALHKHT